MDEKVMNELEKQALALCDRAKEFRDACENESRLNDYRRLLEAGTILRHENERLRAALQQIIIDGDYTAPESMKRIAQEALSPPGASNEPK
jgi:hypothetical protein